jgi:2-polyprenyl-3-methyl-5-hydroxy-6-metoxy-1,4-benzoquinol methylase
VTLAATERKKYQECWSYSQYRQYSPGEWALPLFRDVNRKKGSLIDLGCGTGRASATLADEGYEVTQLDFASNSRDFEVKEKGLPFIESNLWTKWEGSWDVGYCCDVMEHIPPDKCDAVLKRIFSNCRRVFFTIHFGPDNFGQTVGHPLHLNVQDFIWWRDKLSEYGRIKNARDLIGIGAFFVEG